VRGVRLAGGERLAADVVVADVDATILYGELLPDRGAARRAGRARRSSSAFALLLGVEGRTPGLAHHTVAFGPPAAYRREFATGAPPAEPTVYVACPTGVDAAVAPPGHESWFVLVNVPAGAETDWEAYGDRILGLLAERGLATAGRVRVRDAITPADLATRYRSPGGAIYGSSSNGRRAAFLRPPNRGPRRGLYLVGGSSHPGGGLPLVALSGAIVAGMVEDDLR
jgi:phytoene dehydrogenase-like protein